MLITKKPFNNNLGINNMRSLKTIKGSIIQRSKYGVGKDINGCIYIHKNYEFIIPEYTLNACKKILSLNFPDFKYNCLKWHYADPDKRFPHKITFINCEEFDTSHEPVVGKTITIKANTNKDSQEYGWKKQKNKQIWHHKWLWVKDDYKGFDVQRSFERSKTWLQIPDVDMSTIGNKNMWESEVVPLIHMDTINVLIFDWAGECRKTIEEMGYEDRDTIEIKPEELYQVVDKFVQRGLRVGVHKVNFADFDYHLMIDNRWFSQR